MNITGCIFDLDGVIVDTAKYHFIAWRRLANELGFDFSEEKNELLKGVSRQQSLDLILEWGGVSLTDEEKQRWMNDKNEWYLEYVRKMGPEEILEGVLPFLDHLEAEKIPFALGSASRNAELVLDLVGLSPRFTAVIDGNKTTKGKPDPEVFQKGASAMGVPPETTIVFEDAQKGIEAARNGGFLAVGIGDANVLQNAHVVLPDLSNQTVQSLTQAMGLA